MLDILMRKFKLVNLVCWSLGHSEVYVNTNLIQYVANEWQMSIDFTGKAVYTAVWVAAVSLFMELLGISTQKWLTAGGLGTVLISLAGREVHYGFFDTTWVIKSHLSLDFLLILLYIKFSNSGRVILQGIAITN